MPIDFASVWNTLKTGVVNLAETDLKQFVAAATTDGQSVLDGLKDDLQTWTMQLAEGTLSGSDFQDLLLGQKDELEMVALKEAGLAEIQVDQFKTQLFNLIIST